MSVHTEECIGNFHTRNCSKLSLSRIQSLWCLNTLWYFLRRIADKKKYISYNIPTLSYLITAECIAYELGFCWDDKNVIIMALAEPWEARNMCREKKNFFSFVSSFSQKCMWDYQLLPYLSLLLLRQGSDKPARMHPHKPGSLPKAFMISAILLGLAHI